MKDLINSAQSIKIITPVLFSSVIEELHNITQEEGLNAKIIVSSEVMTELLSSYPGEIYNCLQNHAYTLLQTDKNTSFGLIIIDTDMVCLVVYDDSMRLLGTISKSSDYVVDWAVSKFKEYRGPSEEIHLSNISGSIETS